jgi:hypothetical protein
MTLEAKSVQLPLHLNGFLSRRLLVGLHGLKLAGDVVDLCSHAPAHDFKTQSGSFQFSGTSLSHLFYNFWAFAVGSSQSVQQSSAPEHIDFVCLVVEQYW